MSSVPGLILLHGYRKENVTGTVMVAARGKWGVGGGGQRGRKGDICSSVNNKKKEKNTTCQICGV